MITCPQISPKLYDSPPSTPNGKHGGQHDYLFKGLPKLNPNQTGHILLSFWLKQKVGFVKKTGKA